VVNRVLGQAESVCEMSLNHSSIEACECRKFNGVLRTPTDILFIGFSVEYVIECSLAAGAFHTSNRQRAAGNMIIAQSVIYFGTVIL